MLLFIHSFVLFIRSIHSCYSFIHSIHSIHAFVLFIHSIHSFYSYTHRIHQDSINAHLGEFVFEFLFLGKFLLHDESTCKRNRIHFRKRSALPCH
jgi:hypothetical protein